MKFFSKAKDGGPKSPVDAFFFIEVKPVCSIALLKFNQGSREQYHTHAFSALTWFLKGDMVEEQINGVTRAYKRSLIPKVTKRDNNHRVKANTTSWCFTIRGPWVDSWTEDDDETMKTTHLTHGRRIIKVVNRNTTPHS